MALLNGQCFGDGYQQNDRSCRSRAGWCGYGLQRPAHALSDGQYLSLAIFRLIIRLTEYSVQKSVRQTLMLRYTILATRPKDIGSMLLTTATGVTPMTDLDFLQDRIFSIIKE